MSDFLAQNSEYVRRAYELKQDVSTSLDFQGKVNVPLATQPTHAVQFSQLSGIKQDVVSELQAKTPNIKLETINEVTLEFNSMCCYNKELGALVSLGYTSGQVYYGCLGLIPLKEDGTRLYAVAWTFYPESKLAIPLNTNDYATVWLSEDYGADSLLNNKRVITDADNLTDADLEYFEQYGGVDNLLPIKVNLWGGASNFANWNVPAQGFMTNFEKITLGSTSTASNIWWLSSQSQIVKIKMPYNNPLYQKIVALQFTPIACSGSYATNNVYGTPKMLFRRIYNDKYVDMDLSLPAFFRNHSLNRGIFINMPFNKTEDYNDVVYDSTLKDPKTTFPTTTYKIAIKGFWRDDLKAMEFKQYQNAVMTNADPNWWREFL